MKKINVIHIISNLSLGGAQILLLDILKNLKEKNEFNVSVISIDSGEYIGDYEKNGIVVIDLKEKGLFNVKIYFKLKNVISPNF